MAKKKSKKKKTEDIGKGDLISLVQNEAGLDTAADAKRAVEAVFNLIEKNLAGGGKVTIVGFGTFSVGHRASRVGRNPHTGEALEIAARTVAKFKPAAKLKDAVND